MQEYGTALSRYGIAACAVCYALASFSALFQRRSRALHVLRNICMSLVQLLCFGNLILESGDFRFVFLYVFVQIFLLAAAQMVPLIYENVNSLLLDNMCMLTGCGFCILSRLSFDKAVRQYIIVLVSLAISLLVPYLLSRIRFWKKLTWVYGAAGILALVIVLAVGELTYGSRISFSIGDITFQPS